MWVELICGLVLFILLKCYFYADADADADLLDTDSSSSDSNVLFTVADRLQRLYGGKCHVGLHVPDADSASRQNIDMVLVTDQEAVVISVINVWGIVSIEGKDGTWVSEIKNQVSTLESYLEQRGLGLPEGYLSYKVICPNPHFRTTYSTSFPSEIITYDQWTQLKTEHKSILSGWIKSAFRSGKKELQDSFHEQLNSIVSTAPMLDRIDVKGNKFLLGEFLEFKGKQDDLQSLRNLRRSKD